MRVGDCVRALPSFQTWSLHLLFVLHCLICILQSSLKTISSSFHRILAVVVTNLSLSFFVLPLSLNPFFKTNKVTTVIHFVVDRKSNCHFEKGLCTDSLTGQPGNTDLYRFSAFWLRSKCSICSYQLNIWYGSHVLSSILIWFLTGDGVLGLALALSQVSLVLQYHQDRPLPHSTPGSQAICIAIVKRFSWYPFRQRWVLGLAGRDSRRAAGSAYLPGTEVNHDQVGGSSRLSPATLHSVADGIYNYLKRR